MSPRATDESPPASDSDINSDDGWESESEQDDDAETMAGIVVPPLLPVPSDLSKPNDSLCDVCSELDLTPERFVVLEEDDEEEDTPDDPNIELGLVSDMKKKSNCPMCRLVLVSLSPNIPSEENGKPISVTLSWNTDGPTPDPNQPWHQIPQIRILRPYAQTGKGDYVDIKNMNMFPEITMLANDAPAPAPKTFFVRFVDDKIDFSIVRNWLHMCKVWHGGACDRTEMLVDQIDDPASHIPHFRLIDVVDNCIIPAPRGSKYVTLSYVWGRVDPNTILRSLMNNFKELEEPGSLLLPSNHNRIPLTIRDAMQVVRDIHMRYLWVDSLCIIQDDTGPGGSKMGSISAMDVVYGGGYLTIMSATGDATTGLPGVRPGTRNSVQPIEEVLPGLRLGFKTKEVDYIPGSTYYTRAWTYQERLLTKRSLLFIGGQVVFSCVKANGWREDVFLEDPKAKYGSVSSSDRDPDDVGEFEGLIQSYSGLSLTYDSDIYHAFAGMYRYFKTNLKVDLVHGMPDAYFDWFLLWEPLDVQKRRKEAPSWSWSGWYGESWPHMWDWYTRNGTKVRKALRQRTWIIWYQRQAHNSKEFQRVWTPKSHSSTTTARNFYGSHVQSRFPFDCTKTDPTSRTITNGPKYIEDTHNSRPGSGFLQFWTVSLKFKLDKPKSKITHKGPTNHNMRLGIFGRKNHEVGIVFVDPTWGQSNIKKEHEFILLCEGRDERAKSDSQVDEEPGWKYKVMLIEWHGDWAERISVGSIGKGDLGQALGGGAKWKEIILG